ncbi:flotillin-like protein FloA [bacterium]|nr:flotillin-like protein FloA [bacterium]
MGYLALGLLILGFFVLFVIISMLPFGVWIKCMSAGANVGPIDLIAMRIRNVPTDFIIDNFIKGMKGGLSLHVSKIEAHYLSGGNVGRVIDAMISAARAHLNMTFEKAAAIDLAGRDVLEAVAMRVQPRVISTPRGISGIAKNGIEIIAKVKVTVKANLDTMVGGAGEDTILARIDEGIISAIGSAEQHFEVLADPSKITKNIMSKGLDAKTAFEIISIDIADIDIGRNIGAILQNDQAEADKKVAEANAEGRRKLAEAAFQENVALAQEMKAKVVESETEIPRALAESFHTGRLVPPRKSKVPEVGFGADNG